MDELILNEKYLTITFRFKRKEEEKGKIPWDCNEKSLDGFSPEIGWLRADLTKLFHIHRVYEIKRRRLQRIASKKPSLRKVLEKYSKRERDRAKDFIHKLTAFIARKFKNHIHGFEDLKDKMLNGSKRHNRNILKSDWRTIITLISYKARTVILNPKNSTKRCSRCGMINAPKGALYVCAYCRLGMNRQLNAAINLYLRMEGFLQVQSSLKS